MMAVTAWHGSHAHALDRMHDYFSVRLLAEVEGNWTIAHSTACCSIQIRSSTYSLSSCTPSRPFSHALIPALSVMHSFPPFQSCTHSRPFSQAHSKHCQVSSFGCTTTRQTNPRVGHACLSNMSSSGNIDRLRQQHVGPLVIGNTSFRKPATYPMCSLMRLF